jgi:hypothetical protein
LGARVPRAFPQRRGSTASHRSLSYHYWNYCEREAEADGDWHIQLDLDSEFRSLLNQENLDKQQGYLVLEPMCSNYVSQKDTIEEGVCDGLNQNIFATNFIGHRVTATGAYVLDKQHGWAELHPVTSIVPIQ